MNAPIFISPAAAQKSLDASLAERTKPHVGLLSPTNDPVRKSVEDARFYMRLSIHAFRSYDECEGSEGLRLRHRNQKAMAALAWKTLEAARAERRKS